MNRYRGCPFCGTPAHLVGTNCGWFFKCEENHMFTFEGMEMENLSMPVIENALKEWERRE